MLYNQSIAYRYIIMCWGVVGAFPTPKIKPSKMHLIYKYESNTFFICMSILKLRIGKIYRKFSSDNIFWLSSLSLMFIFS